MTRVLLVKMSSLGDVVHALPAVSDALTERPGLEVDWLVETPFAPIVRLHPGVRRVLPLAWRKWRKTLWRRDVRDIAACPNATVKLSAMFENAGGAIDATTARPWFAWCLEAFGADRMMWGSNWPVCFRDAPLVAWREVTDALLSPLQSSERESISGGTAERAYRLG